MARTKGRGSPSVIGPVRLYPLVISILVALIINIKPAYGAKEKELFVSASCLSSLDDIVIRCSKPNEKINIRSASYGNADDCSNPPVDNDCVQPSVTLANEARVNCNGLRQCTINVQSIDTFNSEQQLTNSTDSEKIEYSVDTCTANGYLQQSVPMNLYQVKYECHELSVCNELSDEVIDLIIATDKYPEKSVTNPTCECTYSAADPEYHLNGYTRCNGTVMFITEEFYTNGESEQLEYECKDKANGDYITLGSKEPHRIKVRIDVERSDEESSYEINWFNIRGNSKTRKTQTIVKVDCVGGKLYLKGSVQVILKIVLPIVGVLLIILIILYCVISKRRRRRKYEHEYMMSSARYLDSDGIDMRTDPAADGRSASSVYDQQEPWHSNPEMQMKNQLARPRSSNYLHRSHSAIPSSRNNDLAMNGDPQLSRSRASIRSMKRQAPRPPGPPPSTLLPGISPEGLALLTHQNISGTEETASPKMKAPHVMNPSAPTPPPTPLRTSPADNEVVAPYRRYYQASPRDSPISNRSKEPKAPLSLLALDDSYTQPSRDHPPLTRNYSGRRPNNILPNNSSTDEGKPGSNTLHRKNSVSPQLSNTNNLDPRLGYESSPSPGSVRDGEEEDVSSGEDDMTIMRPGRRHRQPFDGYGSANKGSRKHKPKNRFQHQL
ncbi:uncharacterized protein [Watersipora subatra]|uniref:uncharacterized protein isoform X2 n=1 Tax=Watersipora subatra TaxID=2589382 RepID=UPI00355C292C